MLLYYLFVKANLWSENVRLNWLLLLMSVVVEGVSVLCVEITDVGGGQL